MNQGKFAVEKLIALLTSQRTLVTIIGVILIVFMVQNVVVGITGGDAWEFDEESVTKAVSEAITLIVPVLVGVVSVLKLITSLIEGVTARPPSLYSADYRKSTE